MAKLWKFQKERRKKRIKLIIGILAIILIIGVITIFNKPSQEFLIFNDKTTPNSHQSQIIAPKYLNDENQYFTFVQDLAGAYDFFSFLYTDVITSHGIYYYPGNDYSMLVGLECPQQELIRFTYCDNQFDKNSCKKDVFLNMWLVNNPTDYPNLKSYYTGKSEGFYFTYSCYKSEKYALVSVADVVENRYLYDNKCINANDLNYRNGVDYSTERECLEALEEKLNQPTTQTCTAQTFNEYVCKESSRLYQKERLSDCSIGYTEFVRKCDWGCDNGKCLPVPTSTCDYKEFEETQCIDGGLFQKVRKQNCQIGYDIFLGECDVESSITTEPTTQQDILTEPTTQPIVNQTTSEQDITLNTTGGITFNCRDYETVKKSKCSFSLINSVSSQGFSDLYEDYQEYILGIGVFFVVLFGVIIFFGGKKNGKK